jgi:hypothetical protein
MESKMTPEQKAYYERTRRPLFRMPESQAGRMGCGLLTIFWFVLLLTPCGMFLLATAGEIRLDHADIPEPQGHPLISLSLSVDAFNSGFKISRSWIAQGEGQLTCVETITNYLRWRSDGTESTVVFCQCYRRDDTGWIFEQQRLTTCDEP